MDQPLWVERYRPQTVADCILPKDIKEQFQSFVDNKLIPDITLSGSSGIGKTSVVLAAFRELDCDFMKINASLKGNIDTLRTDITDFASTVGFQPGRKYVLLDEADHLTHATQPALRSFMEDYSRNCGFILTCNFQDRLLDALKSRGPVVEFRAPTGAEKAKLAGEFFQKIRDILANEGVEYDPKVVAEIVKKNFPDFRRTISDLQRYASVNKKIDVGILARLTSTSVTTLVKFMKDKDYTNARKWIGENSDMCSDGLIRTLYDEAKDIVTIDSVPQMIDLLGKFQYYAAFVADQEINSAAMVARLMLDCTFK